MRPYRIGGLLRCCADAIPDDENPAEGEFRPCPYSDHEGNGVRYVEGAWQAAWIKVADGG